MNATMTLSEAQKDLLTELETTLEKGLTMDEASKRRQEAGTYNTIDPPVKCPAWICCLLPCIKSIPSMKAFRQLQPEDAEIRRNSKWIRYDASSVVCGDVIRIEEGDVIPADCVVLTVQKGMDLLVDVKGLTLEDKPRVFSSQNDNDSSLAKLYYGGHVLQGSAICVVTAIGRDTLLATLIRDGKFPPTRDTRQEEDIEQGIALVSRSDIT